MDVLRDWIKEMSIQYIVAPLAVENTQIFSQPFNANVNNQPVVRDLANTLSNVKKL